MATQPYLDATRNGSFTDPAGWTALADTWELSAFDEAATEAWVGVEIESPVVATLLVARSITPEDVGLITSFFTPDDLPNLENAIGAISMIRAAMAGGASFSDVGRSAAVTEFFARLSTYGTGLVLDPR